MADTKETDSPTVDLDEEGKRLQLEAEKAKFRETIAKAAQGTAEAKGSSVRDLVPDIEDAPKGDVTLGENAGAFGPWLAHYGLAQAAKMIAVGVRDTLAPEQTPGSAGRRVLVVENRSLLPSDWARDQVRIRLDQLKDRLGLLPALVQKANVEFDKAMQAPHQPPAPEPTPGRGEPEPAVGPEEAVSAVESSGGAPSEVGIAATTSEEVPPTAAMAGALDLVSLLRTDYALTASTVTAPSSELATLTAAALARVRDVTIEVELDGFTLVPPDDESEVLTTLKEVLDLRETTAAELAGLDRAVGSVASELAVLKGRIERVEEAWAKAVTAETRNDLGIAHLRKEVDGLVDQRTRLDKAYAPATASTNYARQVLAETDAAMSGLVQVPQGGEPALLTAIARERLHPSVGKQGFSHILYVRTDEARGDVVTRRSIIGTSGRLGFLAGVNTSWLLFDVGKRAVISGGAVAPSHRMVYDLENGSAKLADVTDNGELSGQDPLLKLEAYVKIGVVAVALLLFVIAVLGMLNLAVG